MSILDKCKIDHWSDDKHYRLILSYQKLCDNPNAIVTLFSNLLLDGSVFNEDFSQGIFIVNNNFEEKFLCMSEDDVKNNDSYKKYNESEKKKNAFCPPDAYFQLYLMKPQNGAYNLWEMEMYSQNNTCLYSIFSRCNMLQLQTIYEAVNVRLANKQWNVNINAIYHNFLISVLGVLKYLIEKHKSDSQLQMIKDNDKKFKKTFWISIISASVSAIALVLSIIFNFTLNH